MCAWGFIIHCWQISSVSTFWKLIFKTSFLLFFFFFLYNTLTFYVYIGRLGLKQWFTAGFCGTTLKTRRNMSKPWYVFAFEVVGWKYHHRLMLRALFHWRRLGFILCHKKKKKKKWGKFSLFLSENFYLDLNTHY